MLRDVFYYGNKPNVHPREKFAASLEDARQQATTEHFWIINEYCDYRYFKWDFDFEFLPDEDVWAEEHNNVWPSTHQKDSGTWLCPAQHSDIIIYRADVEPVRRKNVKNDNWVILEPIEETIFDFSWHPDPTDPAYIYVWGNQWHSGKIMPTVEYHVPGATEKKYIENGLATLINQPEKFKIHEDIESFDFSWVPNPTSPPYIYAWGNQWNFPQDKISVEYVVEGATEYKYINNNTVRKPCMDNWIVPEGIDITEFDFSWEPNPNEPPFIYEFATQWQKTGGPQYVVPGATEFKYSDIQKVKMISNKDKFNILNNAVISNFDFSWHPDSTEEPYIYVFGNNQYPAEIMPTIEYVVEGATQIKYVNDIIATLGEDKTNWIIPDNLDLSSFDFSWIPNPKDPDYIYEFATQWQKTGGPRYIMAGATEVKYIDAQKVISLKDKSKFKTIADCKIKDFDYSWHPDSTEEPYIYVFGNNQYPAEIMPTIEYAVEGATEIKYINDIVAKLAVDETNWIIPENLDLTNFDFSWIPNPKDPDYIYEFATQWQKTGGPKYVVPGASEIKYVDTQHAIIKATSDKKYWSVLDNLKVKDFDYSWHPDSTEEPFIYVFGNSQYPGEIMPTIEYRMPGATSIKYISDVVAKLDADMNGWVVPNNIDVSNFDFSWKPNPKDPAYIYQFGTQWQTIGGPKLVIEGSDEIKYVSDLFARMLPSKDNWDVPDDIEVTSFDFSWHPPIEDQPYIYIFGTQHQKTGGPQYVSPGIPRLASGKPIGQIKYIDVIKGKKLPNMTHWTIPEKVDVSTFDFSWHPDDTSPPTTYQFGTLLNKEDGPIYVHPDTMDDVVVYLERIQKQDDLLKEEFFPRYTITTTLEDLIKQHPNELFWALNPDLDYSEFDFDWRPDIEQSQYLHAFGSQDNINTQTYFVNAASWLKGFKDINYVEDKTVNVKINIDMFFVDRSNEESHARFEKLKQKFPNIQKTRYLNSWVDTINRCINRASSNLCWILNSELDYSDFDFNYYPNPWQMKMVHVFGTQWGNWGTTFMVNRETFAQDTKYIKIIEHLSNLNFVKNRKAKATNVLYDIIYIDHGNMDMTEIKGNTVIKYQGSYIATFQKMLDMLPVKKEHYVWVASTVCDYKDFDFTYICDPFAKEQLHVFPSDRQKFGDTFLIDVNKLRTLIEDMNVLEDYVKINYNQSQRAKRLPAPVIVTEGDTHISSINTEFKFPYAVFTTSDNKDINLIDTEPMSLWTPESKNIQITSVGGTRIVVPKEAKDYVKRELYDYPYITTNARLAKSSPMDIVFLSNGESGAEENYEQLLKVTHGLPNRVTRVDGVNGRVAAYHAAAEASNTPWMFTVFAKLKVSNKFDWNWQPDRLQLPKHYVFHATNPVNGLKYGHMAMIAYNKKLTLANQGKGLDFTMDDEHEVLEINSGIANFNTDEWSTWRTAFREALKLRAENSEIGKNRLEMWLTVGMGKYNEYSTEGAQHAVEYYEEVNGDFEKLKLSYDWPWLRAMFERKYKK